MARTRRRFGPLFYSIVAVAVISLAVVPFMPTIYEQWTAWKFSRQLADSDARVAHGAALNLANLGRGATWWIIRAIRDQDPKVRKRACEALASSSPKDPARAVEALVTASHDVDPSVRSTAVHQLGEFVCNGSLAKDADLRAKAVRSIAAALEDQGFGVRQTVLWTLSRLGRAVGPAISELDRAVNSPDPAVRAVAARALWNANPEQTRERVASVMLALLTDQSIASEHWEVVKTLGDAIGEEALAAHLVPLLKNSDPAIRKAAVGDLIGLCRNASAQTPAIEEALTHFDATVRREAALYLVANSPQLAPRALDVVVAELASTDESSYACDHVIAVMRNTARDAIPRVARALGDLLARSKNPENRRTIIHSLGRFGPDAREAAPALLEAARTSDRDTAFEATEILAIVDRQVAVNTVPALIEWIKSGHDASLRQRALVALQHVGPAAASAVPALVKIAAEDDSVISAGALAALREVDRSHAEAIELAIMHGTLRSKHD
jgi:HEAT repeat protein